MIKLRQLREKQGYSQKEFAAKMNLPQTTYNQYETGRRAPDYNLIVQFAEHFNVSVDYLLGREDTPDPSAFSDIPNVRQIKKRQIPVLGEIACGEPIYADEQRDVWVSASDDLDCDFAVVAKGDSMLPRIHDGDLVFIKEMPVVPNGRIAAVLIGDEATLKRVYFDSEKRRLTLSPENKDYEPLVYVGEELMNVRILGLAVAAQTKL